MFRARPPPGTCGSQPDLLSGTGFLTRMLWYLGSRTRIRGCLQGRLPPREPFRGAWAVGALVGVSLSVEGSRILLLRSPASDPIGSTCCNRERSASPRRMLFEATLFLSSSPEPPCPLQEPGAAGRRSDTRRLHPDVATGIDTPPFPLSLCHN